MNQYSEQDETDTAATLLLESFSENEAYIVATTDSIGWHNPHTVGVTALEKLASRSENIRFLDSVNNKQLTTSARKLSGAIKHNCGDYFAEYADPVNAKGYALSTSGFSMQPRKLKKLKINDKHRTLIASLMAKEGMLLDDANIISVHKVDLEGDGTVELLIEATHADLFTDFEEYLPEYYSILAIFPPNTLAGKFLGYIHSVQGGAGFQVVSLSTVADLNGNGRMELIVQSRHHEGFQTQIFDYNPTLTELFHTTGGERNCADF